MRAAVYLRQSLDRHGDGLAVARQRDDCLRLCADRGWTAVEYVDNDTSASVGRRPSYERMLDDIRAGTVDAVVAWDLDRLHRRPVELEHFITLADEKHIALATVGGDADLSTDGGRLFARIKGAVARAEVERKSARQKRAGLQRAESGKAWGPRAFGYTEKNDQLIDTESNAVRDAYRAVLAGASLGSIATKWNDAQIATTKGNKWRSAQVRQLLLNPRYAGLRSYNGEIVGSASWPAIVPEDVWRSVNTMLLDPGRRSGATRGRKHLLTGLALCGVCQSPLGSGIAQSTRQTVYRCKACLRLSRNQQYVDEVVVAVVVGRLSQPDAIELAIDEKRENIGELRDRAATLRARLDSIATDFADGELTASQLRTATARIKNQLAQAESEMLSANRARIFDGIIGVSDVAERFAALPLDRRRAIIDALLTVTVMPTGRGHRFDPATVKTEWKSIGGVSSEDPAPRC